jgi:hypothetical protein
MLIASHLGFNATIVLAATLYLLAFVVARNWPMLSGVK